MFTRKTFRRIKPMVIILLFATLVLAMSSASAADDGIADDAAIADAVDYSVDEVSASSDDVAIDTESSDIYSVDDATVTEDDDASGEIIEDTVSDVASEEPKAPLASPSGSEENLGAGTEDVNIGLIQDELYGGDVCDFTVTVQSADGGTAPGGTVTVTIIDTTVPEDTNRRTFVYTIPVVNGIAASGDATSVTINGVAVQSPDDVLLWPYYRNEWDKVGDDLVQRFPDSVTIAYSGDDTYAPKTETKTLTVYPYEALMDIDITQGQGRENEITYGNPLGLVLFEVYDPFDFDNPLYSGNLNVYIVNGDVVDPDDFDPDSDPVIKKTVVNINDGDGAITFDDIFEEGYYLIGLYFDEENFPKYVTWEGFNIIKDTQVGPFVVSSNGLAYQTLAEALAVATEDDTITVIKEGTYKGTQNTGLEIAKSVTIAAAGELAVTFDCEENNNFITVKSGKTVTLKDIAVKNGKADKGGAVYVENGAKLNVDGVEFSHNVANVRGGAIYSEGEVGVMDSIFYQNDITTRNANVGNGGAAIYNNGGKLFVYDSTFDENLLNYVPRGTDGATGDLIDGVIVSSGTTVIDGSLFYKNSGCYGGAITITGVPADNSVIINDCTFKQNTAYDGAGIYMYNVASPYTISNSVFENNKAIGTGSSGYVAAGGAITIISCTGEGKITGSTFTNNSAESDGGAVSVENADLLVSDCKFYNNSATNGAGIHFTGDANSHLLTLTGSVFTGQSAKKGSSTGGSGAVEIYKNNAEISECVFLNNTGGANSRNIYHYNVGTVTVTDSVLDAIVSIPAAANNDINYGSTKTVWVYVNDGTFGTNRDKIVVMDVNGEDKESPVTGIIAGELRTYYKFTDVGHYDLVVENITSDAGNTYVFNTASASFNIIAPTGPFVVESTGFGYATLAAALAKTNGSGDTITVTEAGTYTGEGNIGVTIAQNVAIKAAEGLDVIFDAAKADTNILTIANGNDVKLEGLAFTGVENVNTKFGAVVNHGKLTVTDCEFYDNTVKVNGGAGNNGAAAIFSATDATGLTITGSTFKNNLATPSNPTDHINTGGIGAVASWATSGTVSITDSVFENNEARFGGAVEIENLNQAAPVVSGCNFTNNIAYVGAGINFNDGCKLELVENCIFTGNTIKGPQGAPTTGSMGAAICAGSSSDDSVLMVDGCKFIGNKGDASDGSSGGAIRLANKASGIIVDSEFIGNEARIGSAISIGTINNDEASLVVENCNFTDNNALMYGAVSVDSEAITTTIADSSFSGNTAPENRNIFNMGTIQGVVRNTFDINETTIEVNNIPYGENEVINGTFDAGVNYDLTGSTVSLTINGAEVTATVTDGNKFTITVTRPDVGTHSVVFNKVTDSDSNVYVPENPVETSFTVEKVAVEVTVTADPVTFPTQATVVVNANVPGTYTIRVGNKDYAVVVGDTGIGSQVIDLLEPGTYEVILTADLGPNYDPVVQVPACSFTVAKATPIVEVNDTSAEWNTPVSIPVKVTDADGKPISGTVIVTVDWEVDGVTQVVELDENGEGTANFVIDQALGDLTVTAKFIGNDNYTAAQDTAVLAITNSTDANIEAAADPVTFGEDSFIDVVVTDGRGAVLDVAKVNVTIDGETKELDVVDGKVNIGKLPVGDTPVTVSYVDESHKLATADVTVTVNPASGVQLEAVADNYTFGAGGKLNITVTDVDGNKLNGTVGIEVDGELLDPAAVVTDGFVSIDLAGHAVGEHTVYVTFYNESYLPADIITHFNVTKASPTVTITPTKDAYAYGEDVVLDVTVKDGETGLTGTVVVTINNVNYAVDVTDGTGQLTVKGLANGNYAVTGKFLGNDDYEAADAPATSVVVSASTDATMEVSANDPTYGEDAIITVALTDGEGNPITVEKVNVTVGDGEAKEYDVVDGKVTIPNLPAGDTPVTVSYTDDVYGTVAKDLTVSVDPASGVQVDAVATGYAVGSTGKLDITVADADGNKLDGTARIEIDGELVDAAAAVTGGVLSIDLSGHAVGQHDVYVVFSNDNYLPANAITHFIVTKATNATVTVTSTKESYAYGEDVILDVTVKDGETGLTGTVVVTVDGVGYAVDVTDGTGHLTVKGLANNTYPVTAKFLGNDNYEGADAEAVSVVVNGTTDAVITATVSEPSVDGEATLSVNVVDGAGNPVTGKVNVTVGDGEAQEYDVTDGVASIPLSGLALGENTIVVSTNEYTADPITLTAVVPPKNTADLTVGTDGENITIEAKDGTTPLNGTATVVIDGGEPITVPIDETGKAVIPMDDLAPGQHTVEVTFANDNYEPVSEVATITVPKGTVSVTITPTKDAYDFGEDVVLDLTVKDGETGVTGTVVVTVDGVNYAVDVTSGTGQLTVKGLASGTYEATADFIATDDYDAASAAPANVVVNAPIPKPIPVVTIVASKESYDFGEDVVLDVTVKDGETGVTGTVVVTVDGVEYLVDVSGGSGQLTVKGLINGDYEASADFIANDEYDAASAAKPAKFTVDAPIPVIQVDIVVTAEPDQVIIKLIDENGNPVEGKAVVAIDGVSQEVNVTGGIATIPASAGYHNISVVYEGDDTHAGTAVMKDIVVVLPQKIGTIMTISRSKTITYNETLDNRSDYLIYATLKDEYGNPLVNKTVRIAAHGGIYTRVTNEKGQVRFYVAHSVKGVCTQALSFLGDEKYDASFVATNVQIEAQTVKFAVAKKTYKASAKTKKLTATLKNSKGKALAGKKVVFTVNGKKYTATTNSKGVATVKVSITKKGTYKVTATFAGDKTYKKATKTNKLVIK